MSPRFIAIVPVLLILASSFSSFAWAADAGQQERDVSVAAGPPPASRDTAGPFGPSSIKSVFDSGAFHGIFGWNSFIDDLDGDGDKDFVYFYNNGNGTSNVSAFDLGARRFLWTTNWTTPISVNNFGAIDLTGDGIKEVYWEGTSWLYVLHGNNGTVAWNHKINWFYGSGYGDVDADGLIEPVTRYTIGTNSYYESLNGSTGAVEWRSGPVDDGWYPIPAQLDSDPQKEVVVLTHGASDGIIVFDAVSNTTEWSKTFSGMPTVTVGDFNGSGMDNVFTRESTVPPMFRLFGTGGTELWANNSYTDSPFTMLPTNTDLDQSMEVLGTDISIRSLELIDGGTGFSQGYYYCATYPASNNMVIEHDTSQGSDVVAIGGNPGDYAFTLLTGTNLSLIHQYKFNAYPGGLKRDMDGDGEDELVVRTYDFSDYTKGGVYAYNYTSHAQEWSDTNVGYGSEMGYGWVRGVLNGTAKVRDLITTNQTASNKPSSIVFYDGGNGSKVRSTATYMNPWLRVDDYDGDSVDEVLFTSNDPIGYTSRIYVLKSDLPPRLNGTAPTLQVMEDGNVTHALDVSELFKDDGTSGPLAYSVVPPAGTAYVTGTIDGPWLNITAAVKDWNGNAFLNVSANDGVNIATVATIPVTVIPVNDAPVVGTAPDRTFVQGQMAEFNITASDAEGDILSFMDNTSLFEIGLHTGNVSFTPTNANVGVHAVNVTVADPSGLNASVKFNVTIQNVNDGPTIISSPSLTATEDSVYNFTFLATDADIVYGDQLAWSAVVKANGSHGNATWLAMDAVSGNLTGAPANAEVGRWDVRVTVKDDLLASDSLNFSIDVENVNDPPVFSSVPTDTTMDLGETFNFRVKATDEDPEDVLVYSATTTPPSGISMDPDSGTLAFTATSKVDIHLVANVSVTDSHVTIYHEFTIDVVVPVENEEPLSFLLLPEDGSEIAILNQVFEWEVSDDDGDTVTSDLYLSTDRADIESLDPAGLVGSELTVTTFMPATPLEKGRTYYWTVIPSDGIEFGRCDSGLWSFKVKETAIVNHPPAILPIPKQGAFEGKPFSVQAVATDPDLTDKLEYALTDPPAGMIINKDTGLISWTPAVCQIGNHTVTVSVTDGTIEANTSFTIEVKPGETVGDDGDDKAATSSILPMMLLALVLVIVAVLVLAAIMMRRKGKGNAQNVNENGNGAGQAQSGTQAQAQGQPQVPPPPPPETAFQDPTVQEQTGPPVPQEQYTAEPYQQPPTQ